MQKDPFSQADSRFLNLKSAQAEVIRIQFEPVRLLLDSIAAVFRTLDFDDDRQKKLGWSLWQLRCSVLFGLAPYDHPELRLFEHGEELARKAESLPNTRAAVDRMRGQLRDLQEKENPKLAWLTNKDWTEDGSAAVFSLMAMRKSFGADLFAQLPGSPSTQPCVIGALEEIGHGDYTTLVIPGTCRYLSANLFLRLCSLGAYRKINVLLYEGEAFKPKVRLQIPESPLFPRTSAEQHNEFANANVIKINKDDRDALDTGIIDGLFGESIDLGSYSGDGVAARFLLSSDGKGFHVEESERIRVWRESESEKLIHRYPGQVQEGDFVILDSSNSDDLLDQRGNKADFQARLDATSRWRKPLESLLLSRTSGEVAQMMIKTGCICGVTRLAEDGCAEDPKFASTHRNLATVISNWASGDTYGPGDSQYMEALIRVLVDEGRLQVEGAPSKAATGWFRDLEELRAGRRHDGMHIQMDIGNAIQDTVANVARLEDGIELELGIGMVVCLRQIAMVADNVASVPRSELKKPM